MTDRPAHPTASEMHRVVACSGYLNLKAELAKHEWSSLPRPDADFGNAVHGILSGKLAEMSASEREAWVAKKCEAIKVRLIREILGEEKLFQFVETRFYVRNPQGEQIFSGQLDYAGCNMSGTWLIVDFKSLTGDHGTSEESWQLLSQAVALTDDDATRNQGEELEVKEVLCALVQPLVTTKPAVVKFTVEELFRAKKLMLQKLDEAKTIGAPRIPGNHCRYCACSAHCDSAAAFALSLPNEMNLGVGHLTTATIAQLLPRLSVVQQVVKDIKDRAKAIELAHPGTFKEAGYQVVEYEGNRFIQGQETIQEIRYILSEWVTKDQITQMLELPVGQLREAVIDAMIKADPKLTKITAGDKCDLLLRDKIKRKAGSQRLVKVR